MPELNPQLQCKSCDLVIELFEFNAFIPSCPSCGGNDYERHGDGWVEVPDLSARSHADKLDMIDFEEPEDARFLRRVAELGGYGAVVGSRGSREILYNEFLRDYA